MAAEYTGRGSGIGNALVTHRAVVALVLALVTVIALVGAARLRFDDDYRSIFASRDPDFHLLEQITEEFGREDNDLLLLVEADDVLAPDSLHELFRLHGAIEDIDGVTTVLSLVSLPEVAAPLRRGGDVDDMLLRLRPRLERHPLIAGRLVDDGARATLLVAHLGDEALALEELEPRLAALESVVATSPLTIRISGIPAMRVEAIRSVQRDQLRFNIAALLAAGVLGLLILRSVVALLVVGVGPVLGVVWTMGAIGWAGESINVLNNVVPQLVLAVGFTDAVHLVLYIRRRRAAGDDRARAGAEAVRRIGMACALTSLTTAVGFASLGFARVDMVRRFGFACAAGAVLSFFAVVVAVPLIASTALGDRLGQPARPRTTGRARAAGSTWPALSRLVVSHAGKITVGGVLVTALLAALAARLTPDYRYSENLAADSGTLRAIRERDRAFGGSTPILVRIGWPAGASIGDPEVVDVVERVHEALDADPRVHATTSMRSLIAAVGGGEAHGAASEDALARMPPDLVGRWVAEPQRATLVAGLVPDLGAAGLDAILDSLRVDVGAIAAAAPGFDVRLAGMTVVSTDMSVGMIGDLARSLGMAAVVIFATLTVALGSLRLGLVSVVPNLLPLAAVGALLYGLGEPLQYTSVAVFSIGLGLAVDDTIHFLSAYRRARRRGLATRAAIEHTLTGVGEALCVTTALLTAGLGTLLLSELPMVFRFGFLMCALLLVALVADLLLLPAMLAVAQPGARKEER